MDMQSWFIVVNIVVTIIVGVVLREQIKSQKSMIDNYKGFVEAIDPKKALALKDEEIEQIKKNMSNDILTLQNQVSELSSYVNHIIDYGESISEEADYNFDRDAFITNNLPSCRSILST